MTFSQTLGTEKKVPTRLRDSRRHQESLRSSPSIKRWFCSSGNPLILGAQINRLQFEGANPSELDPLLGPNVCGI
jgi:hypothetical protein